MCSWPTWKTAMTKSRSSLSTASNIWNVIYVSMACHLPSISAIPAFKRTQTSSLFDCLPRYFITILVMSPHPQVITHVRDILLLWIFLVNCVHSWLCLRLFEWTISRKVLTHVCVLLCYNVCVLARIHKCVVCDPLSFSFKLSIWTFSKMNTLDNLSISVLLTAAENSSLVLSGRIRRGFKELIPPIYVNM